MNQGVQGSEQDRQVEAAELSSTGENLSLVCPTCHVPLISVRSDLGCNSCDARFPIEHRVADFSQGSYYDQFESESHLSSEHRQGLENEIAGVTHRIHDYYLPLISTSFAHLARPVRVLDSGCGNGLSVDLLVDAGVDAWGNDISALRKWQWRERSHPERLVVANSFALPFPDAAFDCVLSSGVIEHIGVEEGHGPDGYWVRPNANRDRLRRDFLASLLRVVAPGGCLFLDFPNGGFPIDFWHGDRPGVARWHPRNEKFLATPAEVRSYVEPMGRHVAGISPRGRLKMLQVGRHWYGRLMQLPMKSFLRLMSTPGFRWLTMSSLNPYVVLKIA